MPDPDRIPLDVNIEVCADCGNYVAPQAWRAQGHQLVGVHYEISAQQNTPLAIRRVEDVQKHGPRLVSDEPH